MTLTPEAQANLDAFYAATAIGVRAIIEMERDEPCLLFVPKDTMPRMTVTGKPIRTAPQMAPRHQDELNKAVLIVASVAGLLDRVERAYQRDLLRMAVMA